MNKSLYNLFFCFLFTPLGEQEAKVCVEMDVVPFPIRGLLVGLLAYGQ